MARLNLQNYLEKTQAHELIVSSGLLHAMWKIPEGWMSVESKISKYVFVLLILLTNIQWAGQRDSKAGKGVD
jgi:hypothetical protein